MTQPPRTPDLAAQRAAMLKLEFLAGKWSGEGRMFRAGQTIEFLQTERVEYKQDGLLLLIEGTGRTKTGGTVMLQALGIFSFDDETAAYRMRAFNDGRYLETEVKLVEDGKGLSWGFALGEIRTKSLLRMNEQEQWTEVHEIMLGGEPPRKFMELTVTREK